jgi:hypothetical protein
MAAAANPCSRCGLRAASPGHPTCRFCRERQKVYLHQLHKRRGWIEHFRRHGCVLCRRHQAYVKALHERWDERQVWMPLRCWKGHVYMKSSENATCGACALEISKAFLKSLAKKR